MPDAQQLNLLEPKKWSLQRPVEYLPPSSDQIDEYIHSVCQQLTQRKNEDHRDTDFVRGLTNFMNIVVKIQLRHLNRGVNDVQ